MHQNAGGGRLAGHGAFFEWPHGGLYTKLQVSSKARIGGLGACPHNTRDMVEVCKSIEPTT